MKKLIALLLLFMLSYEAFSQQIAFHGRVIDGINFMPIDVQIYIILPQKNLFLAIRTAIFPLTVKKTTLLFCRDPFIGK